MIYLNPTTGSFATFASDYIHPAAGYMTAWSNIFQWIVVGMSEVIAVGEYMKFGSRNCQLDSWYYCYFIINGSEFILGKSVWRI